MPDGATESKIAFDAVLSTSFCARMYPVRSIVIKIAVKGCSDIVWDCTDYVKESEKKLSDKSIYKDVTFNKKILKFLGQGSFLRIRTFW